MKTQKRDLEVFVGFHPMERADSFFLEFGPIALFAGLGFFAAGFFVHREIGFFAHLLDEIPLGETNHEFFPEMGIAELFDAALEIGIGLEFLRHAVLAPLLVELDPFRHPGVLGRLENLAFDSLKARQIS